MPRLTRELVVVAASIAVVLLGAWLLRSMGLTDFLALVIALLVVTSAVSSRSYARQALDRRRRRP